jgi:hypothetical protein
MTDVFSQEHFVLNRMVPVDRGLAPKSRAERTTVLANRKGDRQLNRSGSVCGMSSASCAGGSCFGQVQSRSMAVWRSACRTLRSGARRFRRGVTSSHHPGSSDACSDGLMNQCEADDLESSTDAEKSGKNARSTLDNWSHRAITIMDSNNACGAVRFFPITSEGCQEAGNGCSSRR